MAEQHRETEPAHRDEHQITYAETDTSRAVIDPWATASNVVFLLVAIYWAVRSGLRYRRHPLIVAGLPVLLLGFVGGSLFHALRGDIWLALDVVPILALCILAAMHFWRRTLEHWYTAYALGLAAPFLLLFTCQWVFHQADISFAVRIPVNYSIMALAVIVPTVYHCHRHGWHHAWWLAAGIGAFVAAITFRSTDEWAGRFLPMGTHFLWHVFGGVATFCVLAYVYHTDRMDAPEVRPSDASEPVPGESVR